MTGENTSLGIAATGKCGLGRIGSEDVRLSGRVSIEHWREGRLLERRDLKNLVVNAGKNEAALLLVGATGGVPFKWIAVGTDDGTQLPLAVTNTTLGEEITDAGLARAEGTVSVTNNVATITKTWNVTGTKAIREAGLFNASSGGDMFSRVTFAVLNVQNGDTLTYTWEVTCG